MSEPTPSAGSARPKPDHGEASAAGVFARWMEERGAGESSAFESLVAAHPGLASELRALREDWEILARLRSSPSFAERLRARHGEAADPRVTLEEESAESPASELVNRLAGRAGGYCRYRLKGEVARGGQGAVVLVWDEDLRRNLAMKVMLAKTEAADRHSPVDRRSLGRFLEEAQVTGQLDHPGIVPVHELGLDAQGRVYFTMKLVRGEDLRSVLDKLREEREGWTRTRVLGVLLRVCEAMAYAHAKGVVHRDLKPGNVMVGRFGEVYVMDWGLARVRGRKDEKELRIQERPEERDSRIDREPDSPLLTLEGDVIGTPAYMAPEQALGHQDEVGPHSDVYSVGAMLYDLLAGHMPYESLGKKLSSHAIWYRVRSGPPDPIHALAPDAPAELLAICERAMARAPLERYPDMGALAEDLRAFLENRVVQAHRTGALIELRKWVERNRALAGALAAGVFVLAAGLVASLILKAQSDRNAVLAAEREQDARRSSVLAEERRVQAEDSQRLAETRRDDVLRLSALEDLEDVLAQAAELWPAHPDRIEDFERWITSARELVAELPVHREKRGELRARALPWTAEEREAQRRGHPDHREFLQLEGRISCLRGAMARRQNGVEVGLPTVDWSRYPSDPDRFAALAWERVKPARRVFGEEALGLVLALRALEGQPGDPDVAYALANAYLVLGRDDEALEACFQAVEIASEARKQEFEKLLAEMEAKIAKVASPEGMQATARELAELEARRAQLSVVLAERRDWRFPEEERHARWWNDQLTKLIDGLEALGRGLLAEDATTPEHGWSVPKRLSFARELAAGYSAGGEHARVWEVALPAIRAAYRERLSDQDLVLEPELGLVPIGPDPASGLWEFALVATGDLPARDAQGKLVLTEESALVLVLLPGGTFTMGAQARDPSEPSYTLGSLPDEGPPHAVTLAPFFLSKYEMTQGQWLRFTGRNPSTVGAHHYDPSWNRAGRKPDLLHPVESVSWNECSTVCARLGLELPSEAQWEYAARAGTTSAWWTGDAPESLRDANAANLADRYALAHGAPTWNTVEDWLDDGHTCHAAVGSYAANPFGLHDVVGNLWEWCLDGYDEWFYGRCSEFDPVCDPAEFSFRVNRGGSFEESTASARSAFRNRSEPEGTGFAFGLRPARPYTSSPGNAAPVSSGR